MASPTVPLIDRESYTQIPGLLQKPGVYSPLEGLLRGPGGTVPIPGLLRGPGGMTPIGGLLEGPGGFTPMDLLTKTLMEATWFPKGEGGEGVNPGRFVGPPTKDQSRYMNQLHNVEWVPGPNGGTYRPRPESNIPQKYGTSSIPVDMLDYFGVLPELFGYTAGDPLDFSTKKMRRRNPARQNLAGMWKPERRHVHGREDLFEETPDRPSGGTWLKLPGGAKKRLGDGTWVNKQGDPVKAPTEKQIVAAIVKKGPKITGSKETTTATSTLIAQILDTLEKTGWITRN